MTNKDMNFAYGLRPKYIESPLEIKSGQQKRREKRAEKRKHSRSW